MTLYYFEFYLENRICKPLLLLENFNTKSDNDSIYKLDENNYLLELQYGFFDILSSNAKEYLNEIFADINSDYLNKEKWEQFKEKKYETLSKVHTVITRHLPKETPTTIVENKEIDVKFFDLQFEKDLKQLYDLNKSHKPLKILVYDYEVEDEISLVNTFLDVIFYNSNFTVGVRKCKNCEDYFIIKPSNTYNCDRIYKKGLTCKNYSENIRTQFAKDKSIKELVKRIKNKMNKQPIKLNDFNTQSLEKKEEFYGNKKAYVNWLLSYYSLKERDRVIKELDLSKYL